MIHYHGLPITPATAAAKAIASGHCFISWKYPQQLGLAAECASSFALDNGAFSSWMSGSPVEDWNPYYEWVRDVSKLPGFDFAVIPDVIDGDEKQNDALCDEWPLAKWYGAPVWHMHESLDRLNTLVSTWPRVCMGSSGMWPTPGTPSWWNRMSEAMTVACDMDGRAMCKLHGLRMLNPDIFTRLPFASADSTNIAQNIGIDSKWNVRYSPANKDARALVLRERIESHQSPSIWSAVKDASLFGSSDDLVLHHPSTGRR